MISREATWRDVFAASLVGSALYVKSKADADEVVARARMIADLAASVSPLMGTELERSAIAGSRDWMGRPL